MLTSVTSGKWPVELVDTEGLWQTEAVHTLMFLPPFVGPAGTLLIHRLAFTFPTAWTTDDLSAQLGLPARRLLDTLDRVVMFKLVSVSSLGIEVPTRLGPLPSSQLRRLPPRLRELHDRLGS